MPVRPYVGTISPPEDYTAETSPATDGQFHVSKHIANMNVLVTNMGFVVALSDENAKFAIYDHNSGDDEPENLLAYTGVISNSAERADAEWAFGDLNTAVYLERGTIFWVALMSEFGLGDTGTDSWYRHTGANARSCLFRNSDYWPTFPNPAGVPTSCFGEVISGLFARARGNLAITPSPVARNKDADW